MGFRSKQVFINRIFVSGNDMRPQQSCVSKFPGGVNPHFSNCICQVVDFSTWNWPVGPEPGANLQLPAASTWSRKPLSHSWPGVSVMAGVCQFLLGIRCRVRVFKACFTQDGAEMKIMTIFPAFAPAKASWVSSAPRSKSGGFLMPLSFLSGHKMVDFPVKVQSFPKLVKSSISFGKAWLFRCCEARKGHPPMFETFWLHPNRRPKFHHCDWCGAPPSLPLGPKDVPSANGHARGWGNSRNSK